MMNEMEGNKTYSLPKGLILDTIYDIIELQNGKLILSDAIHGRVHYHVSMYGYTWELMYTVTVMSKNRSNVTLSVCGERQDLKREIRRNFALLDSLLEGGANVKLTEDTKSTGGRRHKGHKGTVLLCSNTTEPSPCVPCAQINNKDRRI